MDDIEDALRMMEKYGGGFVKKLAALYRHGDPLNQAKLRDAFKPYFGEYAEISRTWGKEGAPKEERPQEGDKTDTIACASSPRVKELVNQIYTSFGSSTGHLFGLRPDQIKITEAIVAAALRIQESKGEGG